MGQEHEEPIERWTGKRRAALVVRVLKGETSVAEAALQHGLSVAENDVYCDSSADRSAFQSERRLQLLMSS